MAEARILVRPDTTKFRAELEASLAAITTKPITIPVAPIVAGGITAATASTDAFTKAQVGAAAETQAVAAAMETESAAAIGLAASTAAATRQVSQVERGAGATALSLLKVRGATLAASGEFLAGAAAVTIFAKAVSSFASFETELNVFRVNAGATADEMARVSAEAKQLGRDLTLPGITASDAAQAMTELAKAGLSVADAMAAARGTLQLATAAQIDNGEAAKIVSSALNSFQLDGSQAVKVADLFAGAAKSAQGSIQDFGPALAQASAVAHGFGISIGDTVTLLTELAKAGLQGGRAGTSLRVALLRLVDPPAAAAKALKDLNIQIRDANGNLRPQVFAEIEKALQGVSKAQRQATEATIFGSDAVRTQIILGQQGIAGFNKISAAVNESGLAQEQAAARTQGLQGDFENLSNQVSALGLTLGQVAAGPVHLIVSSLADTASNINTVADGVVVLSGKFKEMGSSIAAADPAIGFVADHLGDIGKAALLINPVTRALTLASFAMKKFGVDAEDTAAKTAFFTKFAGDAAKGVNDLAAALAGAASTARAQLPSDQGLQPKQIENIIGGFDAEAVRAKIADNNKQLVDVLQTEEKFLEAQLQRDAVKNRPALKRLIEQNLLGVVNDIQSVQAQAQSAADKVKADQKAAAAKAAQAVRDREQNLLSQFGLARDQQQNKIATAAQTAGLNDDLKAQQVLRAIVLKQIAAVKEQISAEGGKAAALVALKAILIQVAGAIKDVQKQQADAQQAQREALVQGINLDIAFDQTTNNQKKETADRLKLIAQLEAQLKTLKKGTNAYKEIRNEIAAQAVALDEIAKAQQKKNQSQSIASFEFLQAQQGFASNLLGNLIPSGSTAGLVGGGGSVQQALPPVANAADAQTRSGPTAGQGNATNHYLQLILQQLKELNRTQDTPEAARQVRKQHGIFDYVSGF